MITLYALVESTEPQDRKEASELLQLALHFEDEFASGHSNSLIDFSFIEGKPDFALNPLYDFSVLDFTKTSAVAFRLESTMRKINSRCRGLLECEIQANQFFPLQSFEEESNDEQSTSTPFGCLQSNNISVAFDYEASLNGLEVFYIAQLPINFVHRSLRDFLLTPKAQTLLHQYTNGPYDARMFYRNARLVQLLALSKIGANVDAAVGLASYILSTLTVPMYRSTDSAAAVAAMVQPVIENLVQLQNQHLFTDWYIPCVLESWRHEESTFLTLAIDFGLDSYVRAHLKPRGVQGKKSRPILDYILRSRFAKERLTMCVGNQIPNLGLLKAVLGFGADPNHRYQESSVWALFLCFMADHFQETELDGTFVEEEAYLNALESLIEKGADVLLPRSWLAVAAILDVYGGSDSVTRTLTSASGDDFPTPHR